MLVTQLKVLQRFVTAKDRYNAVDEAIHSKQSHKATSEAFLETLAKIELAGKFEAIPWCGPVDFVTIRSKNDVLSPSKMDRKSEHKGKNASLHYGGEELLLIKIAGQSPT